MAKQPHHVDAEVGLRLRQARRKQGMSQTELGGRIGVTFQQLQKYEKGTNRISASKMVAICEALNLEPTYFFKDLSKQGEPSQAEPYWEFSKQGRDLIEAFHRINDPRVRKRIVYLVQQVANSNPPNEDD